MTIKELKTLLDKAKGKIIVVEDEKPIMVITPYEEPSFARASSFAKATEDKSEGELTLDDLPL
jgi:hypothetical protein